MAIDLETNRFSSPDVCRAVGISMATLKNWIAREPPAVLLTKADRISAGGRGFFAFSFRRVMQIALVARLVSLGFLPRRAGILAAGFTDVGSHDREPGELFSDGYTVLLAFSGRETGDVRQVVPGQAWDPFTPFGEVRQTQVALINVTTLQWEVLERLGFDRNGEPLGKGASSNSSRS